MPPLVIPENPRFANAAEKMVFDALYKSLSDQDVIFTNIQLVDSQHGDVEIDITAFIAGRGIIVIEVKGGVITFNNNTWWQSDGKGSHEIQPAKQARKNMYSLRDFLRSNWSQGQVRTEWIVAFPQMHFIDVKSPELPKEKVIDEVDLENPLVKIFNLLDSQERFPVPAGTNWIDAAIKHITPRTSFDINAELALDNNYRFIRDMTHDRATLLDQLSENSRIFVHGPAGSGKTWLAVEQAKRWTSDGLKVAMLAYNTGLVSYLEMRNAELKPENRIAFVGTFNQFANYLGTTAGLAKNLSEENLEAEKKLIEAAKLLSADKRFDAIVIDESQDFLNYWWESIRLSLVDPENGKIAAFGDDHQKIFGKRKMPAWNFAKFTLNENIRNSHQIAETASKLVDRPFKSRGPNSFEVEFVLSSEDKAVSTADDMVEKLTDRENWQPGEIALLTTKKRHPQHALEVERDREAYWQSFWEGEEVFYCTVGGFKGLERPLVIVAVDGFHNAESFEDFLYVACTRARDKLVIVANKNVLDKFTNKK